MSFLNMEEYIQYIKKEIERNEGVISPRSDLIDELIEKDGYNFVRNDKSKSKKAKGQYFTGSDLLKKIGNMSVYEHCNISDTFPTIFDPACGSGNLFLPLLDLLVEHLDLPKDFDDFQRKVYGYDLELEFIELTKLRLSAYYVQETNQEVEVNIHDLGSIFPRIEKKNTLEMSSLPDADITITNPPFSKIDTPDRIDWASGRVNQAALFLNYLSNEISKESIVISILPDVLRSGSRYEEWRKKITNNITIEKLVLGNQFNSNADINVFLVLMKKISDDTGEVSINKWWNDSRSNGSSKILGDLFEVSVGSVVPHRHGLKGERYPYYDSSLLPVWQEVDDVKKRIDFDGKVFKPPLVIIRRTSRPSEKNRVKGSIINSNESVAVENHLIVIEPLQGGIDYCRKLLEFFKTNFVSTWMNERIRCRHLTVSSVNQIPIHKLDTRKDEH